MKSNISTLTAICLVLAVAGQAGAAINVFTSLDAWRSGLGSYETETFNDGQLDYGITVVSGNGFIDGNIWWDQVVPDLSTTTWVFSQPLTAWGADYWDLAWPSGPGKGIQVYLDGVPVPTEIPNTTQGTFWGVTSDVPFYSVLVTAGTASGWCEMYKMDNMSFNTVPAPGAILLGALGTALVGGLRRRRMV